MAKKPNDIGIGINEYRKITKKPVKKAAQKSIVEPQVEEKKEKGLSEKQIEKLKRAQSWLNTRIQEEIASATARNLIGKPKSHEEFDVWTMIWSDGSITNEVVDKKNTNSFFNRIVDIASPIQQSHYWTGSLMATLASEGISMENVELPMCSLAPLNKNYTCLICDVKTALWIRTAMQEYEIERLRILYENKE